MVDELGNLVIPDGTYDDRFVTIEKGVTVFLSCPGSGFENLNEDVFATAR